MNKYSVGYWESEWECCKQREDTVSCAVWGWGRRRGGAPTLLTSASWSPSTNRTLYGPACAIKNRIEVEKKLCYTAFWTNTATCTSVLTLFLSAWAVHAACKLRNLHRLWSAKDGRRLSVCNGKLQLSPLSRFAAEYFIFSVQVFDATHARTHSCVNGRFRHASLCHALVCVCAFQTSDINNPDYRSVTICSRLRVRTARQCTELANHCCECIMRCKTQWAARTDDYTREIILGLKTSIDGEFRQLYRLTNIGPDCVSFRHSCCTEPTNCQVPDPFRENKPRSIMNYAWWQARLVVSLLNENNRISVNKWTSATRVELVRNWQSENTRIMRWVSTLVSVDTRVARCASRSNVRRRFNNFT